MKNEGELQIRLAALWTKNGLTIGNQRLFLLGWELMPKTWRINDGGREWWHPSIDFVFMNERCDLYAVEIKDGIDSPRECWSVLCQVTDRACELFDHYSHDGLASFFLECGSDADRCIPVRNTSLADEYQKFFSSEYSLQKRSKYPIHRIVASTSFHVGFDDIANQFNLYTPNELNHFLEGNYVRKGEFSKIGQRKNWLPKVVGPIQYLQL